MVVLYHVDLLEIHNGVIVSFVLSGYLIGDRLLSEIAKTGRIDFRKFWAGRFRRLAPGMATVTVLTLGACWIWGSPLRFREYAEDGLRAVLSILNWRLIEEGTDYFAEDGTQTPFQHVWSLNIEEQFYLVFPIVLLVVAWLGRKTLGVRPLIGLMLVIVIVVSLSLSIIQTKSNQPLAYFGAHTRAWELAIGVLLALLARRISAMNQTCAAVLSWAGLALIIVTGLLITDQTPQPGYADIGTVLGAVMLIAGGCAAPKFGAEMLLKRQPLGVIANFSYGWYLWHWPWLVLYPDGIGHDLTYSDRYRVVIYSFVCAAATYYLFEKRFRTDKGYIERPWRGIRLGIRWTAPAAALAALALFIPLNMPASTGNGGTLGNNKTVVAQADVKMAAFQEDLPGDIAPTLLKAPTDKSRSGCIVDLDVTRYKLTKNCISGAKTAKRTLVVIGDSHAWQWSDTFDILGKKLGLRVVTMAKAGCAPEQYTILNEQLGREYTECDAWRKSAITAIEAMRPQVVVVANRARKEITRAGAETTFKRLAAIPGTELIYMVDTPYPGINIPDCIAQHPTEVKRCNRSVSQAVQFPEGRAAELAAAKEHGASVLDTQPVFCTPRTCPPVIGEIVVYRDASHITATYSRALVPFVERFLRTALSP